MKLRHHGWKQFPKLLKAASGLILAACLAACDAEKRPDAATAAPKGPQTIKSACGMEMVYIPSGEFTMGSGEGAIDAKPAHRVKVDGFVMDQTEVTQEVYAKLVGMNPSRQKNPRNPVEQVTWTSAVKFCNLRSAQEGLTPCYDTNTWECNFEASGYRLPTEAEWEYACRAGTTNQYYFGADSGDLKQNAWFDGNSQSKPRPVAHFAANAWGLYDMLGNVSEWCNDFYSAKYYKNSPAENPRGPGKGEKRVLRGGAWSSTPENCSAWARNCDESGLTDVCLTMDSDGFRCVRRATAAESAATSH